MKNFRFKTSLVVLAAFMLSSVPSFAVSKEIVQLQTQVQALQDAMARMQQSFDERMGIMRNLIETSTDKMNQINASLQDLNKTLASQHNDAGARADQLSGQVQSLHDSVDELKARLNNIAATLSAIQAAQQNIPPAGQTTTCPPGQTCPAGAQPPQQQAPPPDVLYNNALRDYNSGNADLATQEFGDYLKFYPNTDLAGNAQFYIADLEYRKGDYDAAVTDYDKVLEQYPSGNKASAAELKKAMALAKLGRRADAIKEYQALIQRYPRSLEADQARQQLRSLRASESGRPSAARRAPRE
ncbi:MAG: tetratricopeptide repeat protein [Terriglobales bacterium]